MDRIVYDAPAGEVLPRLRRIRELKARTEALRPRVLTFYRSDPTAFVVDMHEDCEPTPYQDEILSAIPEHGRVCVRGPHGLGKTTIEAWALEWFALTRDDAGDDWKAATTASAWHQLTHYLWPEVHKWARKLRWDKLGRPRFDERRELLKLTLMLRSGEAFSASPTDSAKIEGAHADSILYAFDESKRLDVRTQIPTPDGWTDMGELVVGDEVFDEMGHSCRVTYVSPIVSAAPCSRVTFSDGSTLIADDGHLWAILPYARRQGWGRQHNGDPRYKRTYAQVTDWRAYWDKADVMTTAELRPIPRGSAIPTAYPLELPDVDLLIDPYVMGAWLGDGASVHGSICAADHEVVNEIRRAGYEVRPHAVTDQAPIFGILGLQAQLRELGVLGNKHIPPEYLRASRAQRLSLLQGLMDTDGCVMGGGKDSRVSFVQVREHLAEQVAELVRTFGWKVNVTKGIAKLNGIETGPVFTLRWTADVCLFRIARKARAWQPRAAQASGATVRTIKSVEPVPSVPTRCIAVDSPRHLYLAGEGFIPTHNTIPAATFDAAEGAFAGAGPDTAAEAFALAVSTPGEPNGRFYEIHSRKAGYEHWWTRHVTLDEAIGAGRVSADWAGKMAAQWGTASALYINRVEGEFASSDEDGVIPLAWVEAAVERWRASYGPKGERWEPPEDMTAVGVDVARGGADKTVLARIYGGTVAPLDYRPHSTVTTETSGRVLGILQANTGRAIVDVVGIGAGVVDNLREHLPGPRVCAFGAGEATNMRDKSGELGFVNKRSAAWWHLRQRLDPESDEQPVSLPPDDLLIGDLAAPHWKVMSRGLIQVESKDDIRKRIGRSTDSGDGVVMAFWPGGQGIMKVGGARTRVPIRGR